MFYKKIKAWDKFKVKIFYCSQCEGLRRHRVINKRKVECIECLKKS